MFRSQPLPEKKWYVIHGSHLNVPMSLNLWAGQVYILIIKSYTMIIWTIKKELGAVHAWTVSKKMLLSIFEIDKNHVLVRNLRAPLFVTTVENNF